MTSFVHPVHSTEHIGAERAARVIQGIRSLTSGSVRGTATLLLAGLTSLVLVIGNRVIDVWTEEHLLTAWVLLWAIGFGALALLAGPAQNAAVRMAAARRGIAAKRRAAAQDRKMWALAMTDARVMADLSRAMTANAEQEVRGFS